MSELIRLSNLLHKVFASDQYSHIRQQPNGDYIKINKPLTSSVVRSNIEEKGAVGAYQKNIDSTVCWICYDFDVKKKYVGSDYFDTAINFLYKMVDGFCEGLASLGIPYLLEYSGNRGMHVWVFFKERIEYRTAYEIADTIRGKLLIQFESELVALDMFPKSKVSSAGVGFGVKIPVSKHANSGKYSLVLEDQTKSSSVLHLTEIDDEVLIRQANLLERVERITKADLEKKLGSFFDASRDYSFAPHRIKSIKVLPSMTAEILLSQWERVKPLSLLKQKLCEEKKLNHSERQLIVGMLINIEAEGVVNLGYEMLIELFSKADNFNMDLTRKAIGALRSYHFPSQLQIETVIGCKFDEVLSLQKLLELCLPGFIGYEDGSFELSLDDIEVARSAELKYIFQNDEVYIHKVINEMASVDGQRFLIESQALSKQIKTVVGYVHERHEENKIRKLVTLGSSERVYTSAILNQIDYFFKFEPSINSFGYQLNPRFKGGFIFKPWLYLWVEFISNISSALEDPANENFYIIKVDISSFYDNISHEQLKRLMLGGVNAKLNSKLQGLTPVEYEKYKVLIDGLFRFTSSFSEGGIGLPQGPAYARYMAELYLDNLDSVFDGLLERGEVLFYHRYVDDIFFISTTESSADGQLAMLQGLVENLGLRINTSKTKKSRISSFGMDFRQYRAQSKYAVDNAARSGSEMTNVQKNLAINEFMALVEADTCEEDLAFIFSHLNDISELDEVKYEMVLPALLSGKGRGSLFKHVFGFVIDNSERWNSLLQIKNYNVLQSEVLTSTMLSYLANLPAGNIAVLSFFEALIKKLSVSALVQEHCVLLKVLYGLEVKLTEISPEMLAGTIGSCPDPAKLHIDSAVVHHLTTMFAAEQSLAQFTELIFPLCISVNTPAQELNKLAEVFYAKMANDHRIGLLVFERNPEFSSKLLAMKYYQLLCIFSLSDTSSDLPLLKAMWEMCINIFNFLEPPFNSTGSDNWFAKLSHISIHDPKSTIVMAAILDGSICRGVSDDRAIFENYHNMVMIFISSRMAEIVPIYDVASKLESLKEKGEFYRWLLDNDGASHFPSQPWFEHNAFENNCIMLRRGGQVLIRKSVSKFVEFLGGESQKGYAEKIEQYTASDYRSIKDVFSGLSFFEFINTVVAVLTKAAESGNFPNIFSDARIVTAIGVEPFTIELSNLPTILFERPEGVQVYKGGMDNFINCIFSVSVGGELRSTLEGFRSSYLEALGADVSRYRFLKSFLSRLQQLPEIGLRMSIDIAAAAAVFLELKDLENIRRLERFFEIYNKFDRDPRNKHIFCVAEGDVVSDSNPKLILISLIEAFDKIRVEISTALAFNISHDIRWLLKRLENSLDDESVLGFSLAFTEFSKSRVDVRHAERIVGIGQEEYPFDVIYVVHAIAGVIQNFDALKHSFLLQSSSHVYVAERAAKLIILPINVAVGKMYNTLLHRYKHLLESGGRSSYPKGAMIIDPLNYKSCDQAARNVAEHRGMSVAAAEAVLGKWLRGIPAKFRQAACSLISGHVVMNEAELDKFVSKVEEILCDDKQPAFFIKELSDFNGTQRILLRNQQLVRHAGVCGPSLIRSDADEVTMIVDNIISGSQVIKALKYYAFGVGRDHNYYKCSNTDKKKVSAMLKGLRKLKIVQVLYTVQGVEAIRKFCVEKLNPNIVVEVEGGRDIGGDAFFGSTKALSQNDKELIREVFSNETVFELYNNLVGTVNIPPPQDLDGINMVARYRSLPKKCFPFLHMGLIFDPQCAPFERVKENYERHDPT